jgi:hypothetical protein
VLREPPFKDIKLPPPTGSQTNLGWRQSPK